MAEQNTLEQLVADLQGKLAAALEKNAVQAAENEALNKRVAELQGVADKYENPSFELNGSTYELLVKKTIVPGFGEVTASDIQGNAELQEKLVNKNSGIIRKKF